MANYLSQYTPRRSFGFAGQEGDLFDVANQPNVLANIISNESIAAQGAPRNYLQRTGGQMIDLGESAPMNNLRGSPVDVFGQGKGYMQPDGTIVGVNQAGQKFRVQPEGTQAAQMQARMGDLNRRMLEAKLKQEEAQAKMAGSPEGVKPQFVADMGGYVYPPTPDNPNGRFVPVEGAKKAEKPLTEFQGKAALFGSRAAAASDLIDKIGTGEAGNAKTLQYWQDVPLVGRAVNAMSPQGAQQLAQAQRDFVNSVLRLESGATISDAEFANASQQYFPQPGDTPQVIEQKRQNRELAIQGLGKLSGESGGSYINEQRAAAQSRNAPTSQDAEAIAWAKANANDPRAAKILSLHGM